MENPKVAILASGEGTTAEAFIRAGAEGKVDVRAAVVVCNNPKAGIFDKISKLNQQYGLDVETKLINSDDGGPRPAGGQTAAEQDKIIAATEAAGCELVVLMGYLKLIGPKLIERYGWLPRYDSWYQARMLNAHPGPLPATKGLLGIHVQEYILSHHLPYAAQTLHLVSAGYDEGPVVAEHKVEVKSGDTAESLFERVREAEREHLPPDIEGFIKAQRAYNKTNG